MQKNFVRTDLMCIECGVIQTHQRSCSDLKPIFYVDDFWCPMCMKATKYIELKDPDLAYFRLLNLAKKSEIEQFAFDVLSSKRNESSEDDIKYLIK